MPLGVLDSNYGGYDNLITKMGYSYISLKRYRKMLEAHPEWEAMLRFDTEAGKMTAEELESKIDKEGELILNSPRRYSEKELYFELCFAYLKSNYTLYLNCAENVSFFSYQETFTVAKKKAEDEMREVDLPPLFCFDFSENEPTYDKVKNCIKANGFCNKEHRLVKFLEKNSKVLEVIQ